MLKNLEGARLGLFIFIGTVLLFIAIFLIGNKESLFADTITIRTQFSTIEGLRNGAGVRLSGLNIGSVSDIALVDDTLKRVKVTMRIEKDVQNFIRIDSKAYIETEGLVGAKIVSITPGSPQLPVVKDGAFIESESPINFGAIIKESQGVISNLRVLTKEFSDVMTKVNNGEGTIGKLVNDNELYNTTVSITKSADKSLNSITQRLNEVSLFITGLGNSVDNILANFDSTVYDMRGLIDKIESGDGTIGNLISKTELYDTLMVTMNNLKQTSYFAQKGTESLMENMEALKHNWLFKKYFEERGYWDRSEYMKEIDRKLLLLKIKSDSINVKLEELKKLEDKLKN